MAIQNNIPYNLRAEEQVIAIMMQNPSFIQTATDYLIASDFYSNVNQEIFIALNKLFQAKENISSLTVLDMLAKKNKDKLLPNGIETLEAFMQELVSVENFQGAKDLVKEAALKRQLILISEDFKNKSIENIKSAEELIDYAESVIFDFSKRKKTTEFITLKEILKNVKTIVEDAKKRGRKVTGLNLGYNSLNNLTSGFQPEELVVIAARPSAGKSAFALNLAFNIANQASIPKKKVAFFSLEMSNEQLVSRIISMVSTIENHKLKNGTLTPNEWTKFNQTLVDIQNLGILFDDASTSTLSEIRAKCRKLKEQDSLDVIIIDYLQLVEDTSRRYPSEQEKIATISRSFKQLARELKIPIIALSQLSRETEKTDDKRPVLANLRGSGAIEQDADIVIFLHRPDMYEKRDENSENISSSKVELIVAKNRQGATGVCDLLFERNFSKFTELATDRQE